MGISDRIIDRGYDLNIWAYTRIDTIKDGMLEKLKAAGFNWLAVGIEAGDGRVRADVDKGFGQEEVFRVVEQIRASGINVIGRIMGLILAATAMQFCIDGLHEAFPKLLG